MAAGSARGIAATLIICASVAACREPAPDRDAAAAPVAVAEPHAAELAALATLEEQRRATTDFAAVPPADQALGPDPYRIAALPGRGGSVVGLLRGEAALVTLAADGTERARIPAPRSPSGLAVSPEGDVLVVGDGARELAQYRARPGDGRIERVATVAVDALGLRDVALAPDGRTAYVVEEQTGRLLAIDLQRDATRALHATGTREVSRCHGPIAVATAAHLVAVDCLLDHAIELHRDTGEVARIQHDGPLWSFGLAPEANGSVLVAIGGVEDHPLEREDGGFGYIDSFVFLYRLAPGGRAPVRLAAINASALGVVTPKWIALRTDPAGAVTVTTAGYASASLVTLTWPTGELTAAPTLATRAIPPGTAAAALAADGTWLAANPLLDAWVIADTGAPRVVPVASPRPARAVASRIGEALFFTTLMAPWNGTEGKASRFTCETCHFEGYVDGRVHYTGRDDVHATTRPLRGLANNRPFFSRALDHTMAVMVHAEFRVANRHNGRDPWFALTRADAPWLALIAGAPAELSPAYLREAFMTFLGDFTHRANPAAQDHARFTERERRGASVFAARCVGCHEARLVADEPRSAVPAAQWEAMVLAPAGAIVWDSDHYAKTGVVPYVHAEGARIPTLRRLGKKWPYFTNGSARSVGDVLDRFAWSAGRAYHDGAPAGAVHLDAPDKSALAAFLALL